MKSKWDIKISLIGLAINVGLFIIVGIYNWLFHVMMLRQPDVSTSTSYMKLFLFGVVTVAIFFTGLFFSSMIKAHLRHNGPLTQIDIGKRQMANRLLIRLINVQQIMISLLPLLIEYLTNITESSMPVMRREYEFYFWSMLMLGCVGGYLFRSLADLAVWHFRISLCIPTLGTEKRQFSSRIHTSIAVLFAVLLIIFSNNYIVTVTEQLYLRSQDNLSFVSESQYDAEEENMPLQQYMDLLPSINLSEPVIMGETNSITENLDNEMKNFIYLNVVVVFLIPVFLIFLILLIQFGNVNRVIESINAHIRHIIRDEQSIDQKLPLILYDELGFFTGYLNLLLERINSISVNVLDYSEQVEGVSNRIKDYILESSGRVSVLQNTFSQVDEEAKRLLHDSSSLIKKLTETINRRRNITTGLEHQAELNSSIVSRVEYFSGNIHEIKETALIAQRQIEELIDVAKKGEDAVLNTIRSMEAISEASEQVEQVVGAIARIAAQTSLLSMNAAIEAAHAGHFGLGFAVVAQEVRTLSENATMQSRSIREQIQNMLERIESGLDFSHRTTSILGRINEGISSTANIVGSLSQAMERQNKYAINVVGEMDSVEYIGKKIKMQIAVQNAESQLYSNSIEYIGAMAKEIGDRNQMNIDNQSQFAEMIKKIGDNVSQINTAVQSLSTSIRESGKNWGEQRG